MNQHRQQAMKEARTVHFKMYKDGKRWVVAGMFSVALATVFLGDRHTVAAATDDGGAVRVAVDKPQMTEANADTDAVATQAEAEQAPAAEQQPAVAAEKTPAKTAAPVKEQAATPVTRETSTPLTITVQNTQNAAGMTTISGQTAAGAQVTAIADSGYQVGVATADATGKYSINTRVSGTITLTATQADQHAVATVQVATASVEQKQTARAGKQELAAKGRDALISASIASHSTTRLDTDDIAVEATVLSDSAIGTEFTNLNDEADTLQTSGVGETPSNAIQFTDVDQTADVNVVTSSSTLASGSVLGTDGQYDVIELGDGLQGQIRGINGQQVAVVTTEFTMSLAKMIPFYDVGQSLVSLIPIFGGMADRTMQALEDIATITTVAPVRGVESSKTADGDYTQFYVDLSKVNLAQLAADKVNATMSSEEGKTLSDADQQTLADQMATQFEGGFSAKLLGSTTVVTPLSVRPTAEIDQTTNQQDISIASAFYSDNIFQFDFGRSEDGTFYPLYVQTPDRDGNGTPDLTDARNGGGTSTGTETGTETGTGTGIDIGTGTTTTPESGQLTVQTDLDADLNVAITGTGATPGKFVMLFNGNNLGTGEEAMVKGAESKISRVTADENGNYTYTVPANTANTFNPALYGGHVTVVDVETKNLVIADVENPVVTASLGGVVTVEWNKTPQQVKDQTHANDPLWTELESYYSDPANAKLNVSVVAMGKTQTVDLPTTDLFTWEPGSFYNGVKDHGEQFVLTDKGKQYVTEQVTKLYPDYIFDANAITPGGTLRILPAEVTITMAAGNFTADAGSATFAADLLNASDGQVTAHLTRGSDTLGETVQLVAGTDYVLDSGVEQKIGSYTDIFRLTANGLGKLQGQLDTNHKLGGDVSEVRAGTADVYENKTVRYSVTYTGAGAKTPAANGEDVNWHGSLGSDGTITWTTDDIHEIPTPVVAGYTADNMHPFQGVAGTSNGRPSDWSIQVTYTLGELGLNTPVPEGKYVPISGTTAPNLSVTVATENGEPITTTADDQGGFDVITTLADAPVGSTVTATVTSGDNPQSKTAVVQANVPNAPTATIKPIMNKVSTISGQGEANADIKIYLPNGTIAAEVTADGSGLYTATVTSTVAPPHTMLAVTQTTPGGASLSATVETSRPGLQKPTIHIVIDAPEMSMTDSNSI